MEKIYNWLEKMNEAELICNIIGAVIAVGAFFCNPIHIVTAMFFFLIGNQKYFGL